MPQFGAGSFRFARNLPTAQRNLRFQGFDHCQRCRESARECRFEAGDQLLKSIEKCLTAFRTICERLLEARFQLASTIADALKSKRGTGTMNSVRDARESYERLLGPFRSRGSQQFTQRREI
jgi:hypothetical protein